ncbi:MAG: AhpC/TSA family protein [Spirulina sp. SIO3F2]|nr:AhpC/TSA family protein [Spirulina sp. SIO3F2]
MEIQTQLAAVRQSVREQMPPDLFAQLEQEAENLVNSGIANQSLKSSDRAPDFELPNQVGMLVRSQDILAQGPMVLAFKRGSWCPYCNVSLGGLQMALPAIQELGAQVVSISPQVTPWRAGDDPLPFEMLRDRGNRVARQFGLVFRMASELRPVYEQRGVILPRYNGDESFELPITATYIINSGGTIVYDFVNADYSQRPDPVEIITQLRQVQAAKPIG